MLVWCNRGDRLGLALKALHRLLVGHDAEPQHLERNHDGGARVCSAS